MKPAELRHSQRIARIARMLRRKDRYVTQPRDLPGFGDGPENR
jgi:hypothetical protein